MAQGIFRARLMGARERQEEGRSLGEADILVAVFGVPDTNVAFGNEVRQIIDKGSFRQWIEETDFSQSPVPIYLDHGDAHITGFTTAAKKLGYADNFREQDEGLVLTTHYNLEKQMAREAYSDLLFDPYGTQFSFRWPPDEEIEERDDGFEHVVRFTKVVEVSQVGFGAQEQTGVLAAVGMRTENMRSIIRPHSTETAETDWDATGIDRLSTDEPEQMFKRMFAWLNPEGDLTQRDSYRFPHHHVDQDGSPGAANITACKDGIDILNRNQEVPSSDRKGVYAHLAQHITDAGLEPPELRATADEVVEWLQQDEEFRSDVYNLLPTKEEEAVSEEEPEAEEPEVAAEATEPEPVAVERAADEEVVTKTEEDLKEFIKSRKFFTMLQADSDLAALVSRQAEEAQMPDPLVSFYKALSASRKQDAGV